MLDTANKIVALIVAAIGAITSIFNVFFKGERKRKQKYYDNLLKPFIMAYKKDPNMSILAFVQSCVRRDDDAIPKYVFFLLDEQEKEEAEIACQQNNCGPKEVSPKRDRLKKVLIDDYLTLYPNDYNNKRNLFGAVHKILDYLMFLLTFLFVAIGAFVLTSGVMLLISALLTNVPPIAADCMNGIKHILIGLVVTLAGIFPIRISEWRSDDMYSVKKRHILKEINKKISRYDKRFDEYIL